jgi:hypothetical protein
MLHFLWVYLKKKKIIKLGVPWPNYKEILFQKQDHISWATCYFPWAIFKRYSFYGWHHVLAICKIAEGSLHHTSSPVQASIVFIELVPACSLLHPIEFANYKSSLIRIASAISAEDVCGRNIRCCYKDPAMSFWSVFPLGLRVWYSHVNTHTHLV